MNTEKKKYKNKKGNNIIEYSVSKRGKTRENKREIGEQRQE